MTWDNALLTAVIAAIVTTLPGVLAFIAQRRKDRADVEAKKDIATAEVIDTLRASIAELRKDVDIERKERREAEAVADKMQNELRVALGSLREATQSRDDRIARIRELEDKLQQLEGKQVAQTQNSANREERVTVLEGTVSTMSDEQIPALVNQVEEINHGKMPALRSEIEVLKKELELWRSGKKTKPTGNTGPLLGE